MEIHYKTYQKLKIYLNKIQSALPNLQMLRSQLLFPQNELLLSARLVELELIKAQLIDFFFKRENILPYVPPSRCKAIISWYGSKLLHSPTNFISFKQEIIEADEKIIVESNYIILDENIPFALKEILIVHLSRFVKITENTRFEQNPI